MHHLKKYIPAFPRNPDSKHSQSPPDATFLIKSCYNNSQGRQFMECILHKHSILFSYLHSSLKQKPSNNGVSACTYRIMNPESSYNSRRDLRMHGCIQKTPCNRENGTSPLFHQHAHHDQILPLFPRAHSRLCILFSLPPLLFEKCALPSTQRSSCSLSLAARP